MGSSAILPTITGSAFVGGLTLGYGVPALYSSALLYPITTINFSAGVSAFGLGLIDESGQIELPGPIDNAGRATRLGGKYLRKLFTSSQGKKVVEFFGGASPKVRGALNVDLIAEQGLRGSVDDFFKFARNQNLLGTVDEIVASGPQANFLEASSELLKSGGQLIINSTKRNPFGKLPSAERLKELGFKVIQEGGELLDRFKNDTFKLTDGTVIKNPTETVKTTILEKL